MADDVLDAFTRDVGTSGQARWVDPATGEREPAGLGFAQDNRRVWMGAGQPQNVDRALVLYVIRRIIYAEL
jgi:hypothetical protein